MAHLWELKTDQQAELNKMGVSRIGPSVSLSAQMLNPTGTNSDGSITFGTDYKPKTLDLTPGILNNYIQIKGTAPVLPTRGGVSNQNGRVKIQVSNSSKYVSTIGDKSTLDYFNIQDAEIQVSAKCGSMAPLSMYKGKVYQQPTEEEGKTTFDVRTILFDLIDVELMPEIASDGLNQIYNDLYVTETGQVVNSSFEDVLGVEHIHPLGTFDEYGRVKAHISNTNPEKVNLLRVVFAARNGAIPPLGKYTIEFLNDSDYRVTQPDSSTLEGNTAQLFTAGFLQLYPNFWQKDLGILENASVYIEGRTYYQGDIVYYEGNYWRCEITSTEVPPGFDDFSGWGQIDVDLGIEGTKIEVYCSYTVAGNPIRIIKNLIHKALTGRWGKNYALDVDAAVDWDTMDSLELIYSSSYLYVSETNKDNSVFNPQTTDKPIRIKDMIQKILDHIGCQLAIDLQGRLTVASSFYLLPGKELYTYYSKYLSSGDTRKPSHKIFGGGPSYDFMKVKYGYDVGSESYAGTLNYKDGIKTKYNIFETSFPYYKLTQSAYVASISGRLFEIVKKSDIRLEMSLLPNIGLPLQVGDKLKVSLDIQPILPNVRTGLGEYWEVYSVTKKIGDVVKVQCKMIPAPAEINDSSLFCFATYCSSTYC